jgi:prepilin-type N-terminal cleavage/methylation domain-containing protein
MRIQGYPHFSRPRAFTLVELLVVLAILAVLAALLFPVFAQARGLLDGSCLSRRSEVGRAFMMYAQDYDERTVLSNFPDTLPAYVNQHAVRPCTLNLRPDRFAHTETREALAMRDEHANANAGNGGGHRSPNMTYHGGPIMTASVTKAIFWGTSWATYSGDKITGMDLWYSGFGGSHYAATCTEYSDSSNFVGTVSNYGGHVIDTTAAPSGAPSTSTILAEVCRNVTPDPSGLGYYAVYSDKPRGNAGYCAWHSAGSCGGVPVQFAFFFNLDGDAGCNPQDTSGLHSQGLAAISNVSGHELAEAMTDPRLNAWYDASGAENGDKCAWTFGVPLVTFSNGIKWKIQGEWSNAAYNANTGSPRGCLSGGP